MNGYIRNTLIIIVAIIVVALIALFWPRPCTPDVECTDYEELMGESHEGTNN